MTETLIYPLPLWHADYNLNGIAVQLEWQKLTGGICVNIGVGGIVFFAVDSEYASILTVVLS